MLHVAINKAAHQKNKFDFNVIQVESVLNEVPEGDTSIIVGGSKDYAMSDTLINFIQAGFFKENGEKNIIEIYG